jgi:hypothetical protein
MSELSHAMGMFKGRFSTAIQQVNYPQGAFHRQFFIVGSIPGKCYDVDRGASKIYRTLDECRAAIEAAGVSRYQLPDCSWNKEAA